MVWGAIGIVLPLMETMVLQPSGKLPGFWGDDFSEVLLIRTLSLALLGVLWFLPSSARTDICICCSLLPDSLIAKLRFQNYMQQNLQNQTAEDFATEHRDDPCATGFEGLRTPLVLIFLACGFCCFPHFLS